MSSGSTEGEGVWGISIQSLFPLSLPYNWGDIFYLIIKNYYVQFFLHIALRFIQYNSSTWQNFLKMKFI